MALRGRQTPANQEVYQVPEVKADRTLAAFYEQSKTGVPMVPGSFHSGGRATAWIPSGPSFRVGA